MIIAALLAQPVGLLSDGVVLSGLELGLFLRGRSTWPTRTEFEAAELSAIHAAAERHGGLAYWALEFGLPAPRRGPRPT